jgi:hypothetical protein
MSSIERYAEDRVVIDGVPAIRRRKVQPPRKASQPYLHKPMKCIEELSKANIPANAWALALWVIWHYGETHGSAASISGTFASRAGIKGRSARRYAIESLAASMLFEILRSGTEAIKITPASQLKALISRASGI